MYSACLTVSAKLFLSESHVEAGFSSSRKHEEFAVGAHVPEGDSMYKKGRGAR